MEAAWRQDHLLFTDVQNLTITPYSIIYYVLVKWKQSKDEQVTAKESLDQFLDIFPPDY